MNLRRMAEVPLAFLLKRLLGRPRAPRPATAPERRPQRAAAAASASPRRRPAAFFALIALAAGTLLMVPFDAWFTRLLGVLALFAFVVAGVFAIASPAFLEADGEEGS